MADDQSIKRLKTSMAGGDSRDARVFALESEIRALRSENERVVSVAYIAEQSEEDEEADETPDAQE